MVNSSDSANTTLSLGETGHPDAVRSVTAIRWLTPALAECQPLVGQQLVIGRGTETELCIESSGVSRRHAELNRQGPLFAIRDLGSTNGTFVNGRRVAQSALSEGDVLRLGDAVGVVVRVLPDHMSTEARQVGDSMLFGPDLSAELNELRRVAPSDLPVVIIGETGVGKECIARALHIESGRTGPFHAVNCAALPAALAEGELFGYRKGAFTGAEQGALGHVRAAQGGTLLLDELADLALPTQAKLLRVLQEKEVTPLGETRATPTDARIVAACQTPLEELVESKRLRQDLAARLSGSTLLIRPLRTRRSDIGFLFGYFLRRFSGGRPPRVDSKLLERLLLHSWPNNVRELELLTRRLLVIHGHETQLKQNMLPEALGRSEASDNEPRTPSSPPNEDRNGHDLRALVAELRKNDCNVARAATAIGISRQRAYRLMAGRSASELLSEAVDAGEAPSATRG